MAWVEQCGTRSWRVRYRRDDGTIGAIHGFATKTTATTHANTLEAEQREGRFIDPAAGKITLADWSTDWLAALDVAIRTEDVYRSLLRRHLIPRWGDHGLADISGIKAAAWGTARPRLLPGHRRVGDEAAVADAGRRRRGTAHPHQPHPHPPPRTPPPRTPGGTGVGHPGRGVGGRRQRRPTPLRRCRGGGVDRHRGLDRRPLGRDRRPATPQHPPRRCRRRLCGDRPGGGCDDRMQPRGRARPAQDHRIRPHHHFAAVPHRPAPAPTWPRTGSGSCSSPPPGTRTGAATSAAARCARPWTAPSTGPGRRSASKP
jgi:hypothetical protein